MLKIYPAIFHLEDGQYWAEFPDLPGCQTEGETLEATMELASEALGLYLYAMKEEGNPVAKPSDIRDIATDEDGFTTLISCDPHKYEKRTKAIKKTLTIPEWLNDEAERTNAPFSTLLQEALKEYINSK